MCVPYICIRVYNNCYCVGYNILKYLPLVHAKNGGKTCLTMKKPLNLKDKSIILIILILDT